ncbi:hypothetical protein RL72_01031 [Microbacterium azadirachtae]|uniref:Transposase IS30-like HTH domain-containing protein n=1 Tax=Microbacterium azadirachtae TaxID=582680 RepID=A0A0F0L028_9MICO|nr:hypothetical protein RL72_01031 [Microbacterium azadirachtae]
MNGARSVQGGRGAVTTAIAGTVLIAAGAFWLSFTALTDLARRSGIAAGQAWAWPLIVDGIIVVATVAVVALAGTRLTWYPWMLLIVGAGLSVTANSVHAMVTADADVPALLAATVAAVPPLVLLAITHLTVVLTRHHADTSSPATAGDDRDQPHTEAPPVSAQPEPPAASLDTGVPVRDEVVAPIRTLSSAQEEAAALRAEGWSNKSIARHLGVHPSTIGRWFTNQTIREPEPTMTHAPNRDLENGRPTNGR